MTNNINILRNVTPVQFVNNHWACETIRIESTRSNRKWTIPKVFVFEEALCNQLSTWCNQPIQEIDLW